MKLYTRLIEEGVFIFWNSDEGNTSYNLKIRIAVGDDKVELVHLTMPKGQNYYSFDKIGSGDYEIELNGYKENRIYQTEAKKVKITSSVQSSQELIDKMSEMLENLSSMEHELSCLGDYVDDIFMGQMRRLLDCVKIVNDPERLYELLHEVREWERRRGY